MIKVTKLNKEEFYLNPILIEKIEKTPDTVITLINSRKYVVAETIEEMLVILNKYYSLLGLVSPQVIFNNYNFGDAEN